MAALSYKRKHPEGAWDAIVIGSGMGGLASAALLAREAGRRVLVLERHYTPGGFTHVFKRPGYEWDVGLHYVGGIDGPERIGALFDRVTNGRTEWARMPECYDRIVLGDRSFDFVRGKRAFVDSLSAAFPAGRASIEAYLALVRQSAARGGPFFAERALPPLLGKLIGPLLRAPLHRFSDRTVEEVVRPVVKDSLLFDVLTGQCGDYGLTPREASFAIHSMVVGHYLHGAWYPIGGPATIAEGATEVIESGGGEVYTNAEVSRILVERGRARGVEMADGHVIRAPIVISDAGAVATFLRLLPHEIAEPTGLPSRLRAIGPSIGHLCLYLGFRATDAELGLDGTNLWVYPPGDREAAFARFADDPDAPLPVAYISFPSAKDPSFAERLPGRATVEVITLAKMEWFERWAETRWKKRGDAYDAFKARLTERMLEVLFTQRPQLRGRVDHAELSTPLSTKHFTGYSRGEMYGLTHTPARFRLPLRAETAVPGLYLTGADLMSAGVAGALFGGLITTAAILQHSLPSLLRHRVSGTPPKPRVSGTPPKSFGDTSQTPEGLGGVPETPKPPKPAERDVGGSS